jgi:beta-mannosidase
MQTFRPRVALQWQLARHRTADEPLAEWIPATVPGAVQLDWAAAHGLPDFTVGRNVELWDGLEDFHWTYRSRIDAVPARRPGERMYLRIDGVDYAAEVFVGSEQVGTMRGVQTPLAVDITDRLTPGVELRVRVHPAPKSHDRARDRTQANRTCKPAVSYEWDFHPRLIPLGLWRGAWLEIRPAIHFATLPEVEYRLSDDLKKARGQVNVTLSRPAGPGTRLRWTCSSPAGAVDLLVSVPADAPGPELTVPFALDPVTLWWPHDQGTPALYHNVVELLGPDGQVLDRAEVRTGFRRVRLVMAPDQWKSPTEFPKSRSLPPITFEVNGRALFVKGTNWVCPDIFPGAVTPDRYAEQLRLVREANLTLVRVWGGAIAPPEEFHDLCDELGLLVWQEFPLACNSYPDDPEYLAELDRESRSLIRRLRRHASVVLWCGGNELFNFWSGMTEQSLALRLLNRNCYELDPTRPFLATAPLEGMGHGHYLFRDPGTGAECWSLFQHAHCTAYSEFGVPASPSAETLRRILPPAEVWPPRPGTSWQLHHAFGAWMPSSHLYLEEIEYYFGPSGTLEQLVERGQLLQSAGLQGLFEEVRRQKPVASLALNWCFNEPWPAAANNSLVAWPAEPKPALAAVAQACRPTLASARVPRFSWRPGETFTAELWLLHDGPAPAPGVTIRAWLEIDSRRHPLGEWIAADAPANTNVAGPRVEAVLPPWHEPRFTLHLAASGRPEWDSHYTFIQARAGREEGGRTVEIRAGTTNF